MDNLVEEFRAVKGYEGIYEISNFGRVKALPKIVSGKFGSVRLLKEKIFSTPINSCGYRIVCLRKNNKSNVKKVHVLVASAFLNHEPDGTNKVCVHHIDECKTNNNVNNLELVSNRHNAILSSKRKYSKYKNIVYNKTRKTWKGSVIFKSKRYQTKTCKSEDEAYELLKVMLDNLGLKDFNVL